MELDIHNEVVDYLFHPSAVVSRGGGTKLTTAPSSAAVIPLPVCCSWPRRPRSSERRRLSDRSPLRLRTTPPDAPSSPRRGDDAVPSPARPLRSCPAGPLH